MPVKLPEAADYGARPSIGSGRLDAPGQAELITGSALDRAASAFASIAVEKKQKNDRLQYALAKNELLQADIRQRQALKGDEDWKTYDERYSSGIESEREKILGKYNLTKDDQVILSAESDLIRERGRVQVGDAARSVELDEYRGSIDQSLLDTREQVLVADPDTANDLMITQIEMLRAAEEKGAYTDEEVVAKIHKYVTDVSLGRLEAMPVENRVAELELSLAGRKARGPIDIEDIQAGGGTGSIADFLHKDIAVKMLDQAKAEKRSGDIKNDVFSIIEEVTAQVPGSTAADIKERNRLAKSMISAKDPNRGDKIDFLIQELGQRNSQDMAIEKLQISEIKQDLSVLLDNGASYGSLPEGELEKLTLADKAQLQTYARNVQRNNGYAEITDDDTYYKWSRMSSADKIETDLSEVDWKNAMTYPDWRGLIDEQRLLAERQSGATTKDPNIYEGAGTDVVVKRILLGGENALYDEVPDEGTEEYQRWQRINNEVDAILKAESLRLYAQTGSGYLEPNYKKEIISQVLGNQVTVDTGFFGKNKARPVISLDEEERERAWVPMDKVSAHRINVNGVWIDAATYIGNLLADEDPSTKDIEKMYFRLFKTEEGRAALRESNIDFGEDGTE